MGSGTQASSNVERFLSFNLGTEMYGVEILRVREIIGLIPITPLPRAPEHVRGVMNLRGRIIPVIDLRSKFGLPRVEATKETCIIVMEGDGEGVVGVVVDGVREVEDIARESIEAPTFGPAVPTECIRGMARAGDGVVILLNVGRVLGHADSTHGTVHSSHSEKAA